MADNYVDLPLSGSGSGVIISINGDTTPAQLIVGGTGISVATAAGTTTITNTSTGSGDVVGPGSATDNAICRFDGTTGKLIQNSSVTIDDTGHIGGVAGTSSAVSFYMNGDVDTGFVSTGANELSTYAGGTLVTKEFAAGFAWFNTGAPANFLAASWSTNAITFTGTNINSWTYTSSNTSSTNYTLGNTSSGALSWTFSSLGSGNGDYLGGFNLTSDRAGANPVIQVRKKDQIILGGNSGILNSVSVVSAGRAAVTNIGGTTTANAVGDGGTITGSGTKFLQDLGVGDRISLSSNATNYATVASIASNTSLTIQGLDFLASPFGDGSVQNINAKRAIHRWDNGSAVPVANLNDNGMYVVGDPTLNGVSAFFTSDACKFLSFQTYTGINNLLSIGNAFNMTWTPVNDTNLGTFGQTAASAGGAQMTITGSKNLNGGITFGNTFVLSALGSFGAMAVDTTAGSTTDGVAGIYFATEHDSLGGTLTLGIGGLFNFDTTDSVGLGTPTGLVVTGIGGAFTASAQGCDVTNAISGKFLEPYVVANNGGIPTITNQTAAWVDGTLTVTQTVDTSTGNVTALAVPTSHIHLTGNPTVKGIHADTFSKYLILTCDAGMTLTNQDAGASAIDRIITGSGASIICVADGAVTLKYDTTNSRWRVVSSIA